MWMMEALKSTFISFQEGTYFFQPPCRYVFPGAEVYEEEDDSDSDDDDEDDDEEGDSNEASGEGSNPPTSEPQREQEEQSEQKGEPGPGFEPPRPTEPLPPTLHEQ